MVYSTIHVGKYNLNSIRMGYKKKGVNFVHLLVSSKKTSSWTSLFFGGGNRSPPPFRSPSAKWPFKSFHRYSVFAAWPPHLAASSPPPRPHVRRRCEHKSRSCQKNRPKHQWETSQDWGWEFNWKPDFFFQFAIASFGKCWPKLIYCWWWKKFFRRTHQLRLVRLSHDFVVYQKNWETTWDTVDGQNPAPPRMMIIPLFIGF